MEASIGGWERHFSVLTATAPRRFGRDAGLL